MFGEFLVERERQKRRQRETDGIDWFGYGCRFDWSRERLALTVPTSVNLLDLCDHCDWCRDD